MIHSQTRGSEDRPSALRLGSTLLKLGAVAFRGLGARFWMGYQGLVVEPLSIVRASGADLWVVPAGDSS